MNLSLELQRKKDVLRDRVLLHRVGGACGPAGPGAVLQTKLKVSVKPADSLHMLPAAAISKTIIWLVKFGVF